MHRIAYLFLTLSIVATAGMVLCFLLALFGDLLPGTIGERSWARLALPFGMATLFTFGVGAALAREAAVRSEFDRAVGLLRRDLDRSLRKAPNAAEAVAAVMPAISRFRRAAEALGRTAPRTCVDLADLIVYQEDDPDSAHPSLVRLQSQLPAPVRGQGRPA